MAVARTWFWTRSLIRSMGAAAVFETAAETPPTVGVCQQCIRCWIQLRRRAIDEYPIRVRPIDTAGKMREDSHTQEVDHEGLQRSS
jgi:hypothetical protein